MGTCIDYAVRFGGPNEAKTAKAREYIREIQDDNVEYSGNGVCDFSDPPQDAGAFTQWHCYCKAGDQSPDNLREKLIELTIGGDFKFWFYWDCTDGCNESSVEEHHDGVRIVDFLWAPGILGLDASIAAATLDVHCDAGAVVHLINCFLSNSQVGWDENDISSLENAHAAGVALARAFQHWPSLLLEQPIQGKVDEVTRTLQRVLEDGGLFFPDKVAKDEQVELHAMLAKLESEVLDQVTKTNSNAKCQPNSGKRL